MYCSKHVQYALQICQFKGVYFLITDKSETILYADEVLYFLW